MLVNTAPRVRSGFTAAPCVARNEAAIHSTPSRFENRRRSSERPVAIPILMSDFFVAELNKTGSAATPEPAKSDRLTMEESRMTYFRKLLYRSRQFTRTGRRAGFPQGVPELDSRVSIANHWGETGGPQGDGWGNSTCFRDVDFDTLNWPLLTG